MFADGWRILVGMAKESEYGGEETVRSQGIQPMQPDDALRVNESLRLVYATDQDYEESVPGRYDTPRYLKEG